MGDKVLSLREVNRCSCGGAIHRTSTYYSDFHPTDSGYSGTCFSHIRCSVCGKTGKQTERKEISRKYTDL